MTSVVPWAAGLAGSQGSFTSAGSQDSIPWSVALAPPPIPPTLVVAGGRHRELVADLVDLPVLDQSASAYVVLRHGRPVTRSHIPGHRAALELDAKGTATGQATRSPATRPPRRVTLTGPSRLLEFVHLVVAPDAPASSAGAAVLRDAVRAADGLVWMLDQSDLSSAERRAEIAALAGSARRVAVVDGSGASIERRAAIVRQIPELSLATWHHRDDRAGLVAQLTATGWLEPPVAEGAAEMAAEAANGMSIDLATSVRVTDDDQRWRATLARELHTRGAAERDRVVAGVAAIRAAGPGDPGRLDTELHALSLHTTGALDAAARDLIGAVFGEIVAGRLTDAVRARIVRAIRRHLEPDDRTLLVTATAGVALVSGVTGALSATGAITRTVLPPIGAAVSGSCHLMCTRRGAIEPDWLDRALVAIETQLVDLLAARFAALAEAVEAVAADAVDHGVLLA
jgi:hypothetical protein